MDMLNQVYDFSLSDLEDIFMNEGSPPEKKSRGETSSSSQHSLVAIEANLKEALHVYVNRLSEDEDLEEFDDYKVAQLYQVLTADTGALQFTTRKECRKLYRKRLSTATLSLHLLFCQSQQNSTEESAICFLPKQETNSQNHRNSIGLIDQRGSGKTKFVQAWSLKALEKMSSCVLKKSGIRPSYLFLIYIQEMDFSKETTLLECLLSTCLPNWNHDPESDRYLLNLMVNDENVVIIFDDICHLPDCSTNVPGVLLHGRAKPQIFILNILSKNLLQKAKKLVVCHPLGFYQRNPIYRPDSLVGLRPSFGHFSDWIENNIPLKAQKLYSFCRNYVNSKWSEDYIQSLSGDSWLFVNVLVHNLKQYTLSWPDCLKQDVYKVASLAWIGIKEKIVYYPCYYCESLNDQVVATFLHTYLPESVSPSLFMGRIGLVFSFPDIILQEFFAAFHLAFTFPPEEFDQTLPLLCQDRFKVVRLFLFGLCNKETLRELQNFFPGIPSQVGKIKKGVVRKIGISLMNKVLNLVDNFSKFKHVCQCVYESQDSEILEAVVEYLPECLNIVFDNLSIIDARQIAYVLKASKQGHIFRMEHPDFFEMDLFDEILASAVKITKWELIGADIHDMEARTIGECLGDAGELELNYCDLYENAFEELVDAIPGNKVLKRIEVSSTRLDHFGLKNCIKHVQILILSDSHIDLLGVELMATEIDKLRQPLEKLDLSSNNLKSEGAIQLSKCIHNIKVLNISRCQIGTKGIEKLAKKIKPLKVPMEKLSVSGNEIGNAGAMFLASCIFNIDKLHAENCDFGGRGVKALAEKISVRLNPIKCLNLSHNSIKAKGAFALGKCIHNFEKLKLKHCKINSLMLQDICKNIPEIHKQVKSLVLSNNEICDAGAFTLSECMHNLDDLRIANCDIESLGAKHISDQLYTRQTPMCCLDFSSNDLSDSGIVHLAKSASKVKRLHLSTCKFTLVGARALAEHIGQLQMPMELLNLACNLISDEGVNQLASCLHNLGQLNMNHCSLNDKSLKALLGPASTLTSMLYLRLKGNKFSDESVQCICGSLCKVEKMDLVSCSLPKSAKIQIKSQLEELNLHEDRVLFD